jgi:hypothetical protein
MEMVLARLKSGMNAGSTTKKRMNQSNYILVKACIESWFEKKSVNVGVVIIRKEPNEFWITTENQCRVVLLTDEQVEENLKDAMRRALVVAQCMTEGICSYCGSPPGISWHTRAQCLITPNYIV